MAGLIKTRVIYWIGGFVLLWPLLLHSAEPLFLVHPQDAMELEKMNDDGVMVGKNNGVPVMLRWPAVTISGGGVVNAINNSQQAVGIQNARAFIYDPAKTPALTLINTLGGAANQAYGINDAGFVVGTSEISPGLW